MSKKIGQVRFYKEKDPRNQPRNITMTNLASGSIFSENYPILQLGIQTLPGVKFHLNYGVYPITVGATGIYDLNLDGITEITHLSFDPSSISMINNNPDSSLIIDFIYNESEVI